MLGRLEAKGQFLDAKGDVIGQAGGMRRSLENGEA